MGCRDKFPVSQLETLFPICPKCLRESRRAELQKEFDKAVAEAAAHNCQKLSWAARAKDIAMEMMFLDSQETVCSTSSR